MASGPASGKRDGRTSHDSTALLRSKAGQREGGTELLLRDTVGQTQNGHVTYDEASGRTGQSFPESCDDSHYEPMAGPSFLGVTMMDVMEAIRLMQFSVDQLRLEVNDIKKGQEILSRNILKETRSVTRREERSCRSGELSGEGRVVGGTQVNVTVDETRADRDNPPSDDQSPVDDRSVPKPMLGRRNSIPGSLQETEIMIYGDSRTRFLDRAFCEKNREKRMRVCLPGAKLKDLSDRLDDVIRGSRPDSVVIVHGGVNDVGNTLSEELFGTYKTMVAKLVKSRRKCIITGILPKYRAGLEWSSRALGMNERVRKLCKENNIQFLDYWGRFWDKKELYSMDGYHFSRSGVLMLSELYEKELTQGN